MTILLSLVIIPLCVPYMVRFLPQLKFQETCTNTTHSSDLNFSFFQDVQSTSQNIQWSLTIFLLWKEEWSDLKYEVRENLIKSASKNMFEHKMTAHGIHSSKDHKILNCSNLLEYPYILNKVRIFTLWIF